MRDGDACLLKFDHADVAMDVIWVLEGETTRDSNFLNTYLSKYSSLSA